MLGVDRRLEVEFHDIAELTLARLGKNPDRLIETGIPQATTLDHPGHGENGRSSVDGGLRRCHFAVAVAVGLHDGTELGAGRCGLQHRRIVAYRSHVDRCR